MARTKIRTYLELRRKGETQEAAMAASGVALATAKIQDRLNGLSTKKASKVSKAKKVKKVEEVENEEEDVDLEEIA